MIYRGIGPLFSIRSDMPGMGYFFSIGYDIPRRGLFSLWWVLYILFYVLLRLGILVSDLGSLGVANSYICVCPFWAILWSWLYFGLKYDQILFIDNTAWKSIEPWRGTGCRTVCRNCRVSQRRCLCQYRWPTLRNLKVSCMGDLRDVAWSRLCKQASFTLDFATLLRVCLSGANYRSPLDSASTRWFIGAFFVISEMWAMKDCSTRNEALITSRLGIRWFGQT